MAARGVAVAAMLVSLFASIEEAALGDEADPHALAVKLFEEAGRAEDQRAFDEACPKFAKVVELEPAKLGAKLALADCYEQAGKLASAVAAFREASIRAGELGDERKARADGRAAALEAKAPRLTIRIPESLAAISGVTITRDGIPVDAADWNRAVLVDPGDHTIVAGASGKKPWSGTITSAVDLRSEIVIGALEDAPVPLAPPAMPVRPVELPRPATKPTVSSPPVWVWATGGAGLASLGVAIGFGIDQATTQQAFDDRCKDTPRDVNACDERKTRLYRDFGAWIGFGTAGAGALTAAIVGAVLSARSARSPALQAAPIGATVWFAPQGAGAAFAGRF